VLEGVGVAAAVFVTLHPGLVAGCCRRVSWATDMAQGRDGLRVGPVCRGFGRVRVCAERRGLHRRRVLLGLAGAAMIVWRSPSSRGCSTRRRGSGVGIWGAANFIGSPPGTDSRRLILSNAWWGWIFLMNVPVALVGLIAVVALVLSPIGQTAQHRLRWRDPLERGLVAVMYGVVQAGSNGWGSLNAILPALVGLWLAGFVLWERA